MAKLNQLLTLERMLKQYDGLNIENPQDIYVRGQMVMEQVDCIIAKLTRLVESKTRLSGRNVLTANFSTMINASHWLNSKLLNDLPRADSRNLRNKIYEMVDLMLMLMAKITDVDGEYAERFFERLKKRCYKYSVTKYDLWKKRQPVLTIKEFVEYQVELTAKLLDKGILEYYDRPSGEDKEGVNVRMLLLRLKDRKVITEEFKAEAAKLRKISYWDGDMFKIKYELFRDYIFRNFSRFSYEQRIMLFEYDVEMKQVHDDIRKYLEEHQATESEKQEEATANSEEVIDTCFKNDSEFVREKAKKVVDKYYLGSAVNLTLIEIAFYDHNLLSKRNTHKAFIRSLVNCGAIKIADESELNRLANGMAYKMRNVPPTGYLEWQGNAYGNDRKTCLDIGKDLGSTIPYCRQTA